MDRVNGRFVKGEVVQFNENHKWCGSLGIIDEVRPNGNGDFKYMIGVPIPEKGTAFMQSLESANEIEFVGRAILTLNEE